MISDFFFPGLGGVENHILQLSSRLIKLKFKVIAATYQRGDRCGIRHLENGLKIYHLPFPAPCDGVTFPSIICFLPLLREIVIREEIDIIHGHQASRKIMSNLLVIIDLRRRLT